MDKKNVDGGSAPMTLWLLEFHEERGFLFCCCYFNKTTLRSAILRQLALIQQQLYKRGSQQRPSLSGDLRLHQNKQQSFAKNHYTVTLKQFTFQALRCRQCFSVLLTKCPPLSKAPTPHRLRLTFCIISMQEGAEAFLLQVTCDARTLYALQYMV